MVIDRIITVPKNALDVNTGIDIQPGDRVVFAASGDIWSGVHFTLRNDPFGWGPENPGWHLTMSRGTFPLPPPRGRLFSMLGRFESYFPIERGVTITRAGPARRLFLRINHNNAAAGDGAFTCRVQVWR